LAQEATMPCMNGEVGWMRLRPAIGIRFGNLSHCGEHAKMTEDCNLPATLLPHPLIAGADAKDVFQHSDFLVSFGAFYGCPFQSLLQALSVSACIHFSLFGLRYRVSNQLIQALINNSLLASNIQQLVLNISKLFLCLFLLTLNVKKQLHIT
jgi:hypothetical protein